MKFNAFGKAIIVLVGGAALLLFLYSFTISSSSEFAAENIAAPTSTPSIIKKTKHIATPEPLKAIYMTQCVAGTPSWRERLTKMIDDTEINAVVVDIKDYSGTVSFKTGNPEIDSINGPGCKVSDMKEYIENLHERNIYVIGRITVFQDPVYTKLHPELAVKRKSDGKVWKDRKGISFIDVGAKPFWDHILALATSSYDAGFDEINFDYIRYPSDGDMKDIDFTHSGAQEKKEMLKQFFEYLDSKIAGTGIVTSADIFGMTTTNTDDLGIGQILEYALLNFDYVAPMVYPSHYPPKFNGWPDPNKVPYEIIHYSMSTAVARAEALKKEVSGTPATSVSSSTPPLVSERIIKRLSNKQLRPWLQDFDYPVSYTPEMVRKQIQATYDSGLTSWMLWDPGNTYTQSALLSEN